MDDIFQEKSNVVELNSTIETHWNNALFGSRRQLFFAGVKKLVRKWAGGEDSVFRPVRGSLLIIFV